MWRNAVQITLLAAVSLGARPALAQESALTAADRAAFAWYDGIGLPSCRGKPLVRITWENTRAAPDAPRAERMWELDGFVVAEEDGMMTVLDGDLWPRKVTRAPPEGWTGGVATRDLGELADACTARLRALLEDPGAVEPADVLYRGLRVRFGEEARALALARQCAENGLPGKAHELLAAARAIPHVDPHVAGALPADTPLADLVARQLHESVIWRIVFDVYDAEESRAHLLGRLRGWLQSFPDSPHRERAGRLEQLLAQMLAEDAAHERPDDAALAALAPEKRAAEWIFRLRDQQGDVRVGYRGHTSIEAEGRDAPVAQLVRLGGAAVPALIDALTDGRLTRTVLYRMDMRFERQVVARVGDLARVALEDITRKEFWQPTAEAPSMFQGGVQDDVQARWQTWFEQASGFAARLAELAGATDPAERARLAAALPDRGSGSIAGSRETMWGSKSFVAAVPGLTDTGARDLLTALLSDSPYPRTRALAAWSLLDLGSPDATPAMIRLWREMAHAQRADPVQGGAVVSYLAACGDVAAIRALGEGLDERSESVRELVVLAFRSRGLGAIRGFAADGPEGVPVVWAPEADLAHAIEDLIAGRLGDLVEDPLGRLPRQEPICDMVPEYDCGRRIADAATLVLNARWPAIYPAENEPVRPSAEFESLRTKFTGIWQARRRSRR